MPSCRSERSSFAFTLVELLVAIAVVGVVIALTIPALRAMRQQAREAACTSRIGQCAAAATQYASDASDLPPILPAVIGDTGERIRARLVVGSTQVAETDYFGQGRFWTWVIGGDRLESVQTLMCPGVDITEDDPLLWSGAPPPAVGGFRCPPSTYVLVDSVLAHPTLWTPAGRADPALIGPQRWASCEQPSRKVALYEGLVGHEGGTVQLVTSRKPPTASVAFFDGHADHADFSRATPGFQQPFATRPARAMSDTPSGILGSDL